ncbi:MAG TPA: hypothetical protein VMB03_20490 [Bryobacteraceae bacterium]|nr:hypothetical protein [Bryobacteraceae bacterium]
MKGLLPVLALVWSAQFAAAQTAETHEQRGKRVVYEALKALGGDAYLHMNDRVETGRAYSFYREQISGLDRATIYTRYLPPVPGKLEVRERENFGPKEDSGGFLFLENAGWEITFRGARPLDADKYASYRLSTLRNILYILRQRLDEPGLAFYSQGTDMFENRPVEIVDITDADTNTVTVYFDARNKWPVRQSFRHRNEQFHDFDTEVTIFALYRDVGGGVMWPCNVRRERNGDRIYEMFADEVKINQNLSDDLFKLPQDVVKKTGKKK